MKSRPAESAGVSGGILTALVAMLGGSTTAVAIVGTIAAAIPAVVTYVVANGGIRGVVRKLWRGQA